MGKSRKRAKRKVAKCPTPNKVSYNKPFDAFKALTEIKSRDPLRGEFRMYKCWCKKYHLSSSIKED